MNQTSSDWRGPRIVAAVVAALMGLYVCLIVFNHLRNGFQALGALFGLVAGVIGLGSCWFAFFAHKPEARRQLLFAMIGGGALGAIGFAAGFIGPILFSPEANQGPLLGILLTGPLGFVVGSIMGFIAALATHRRAEPPPLNKR